MVRMYIVTNTAIFVVVRLLLLRYNYMFRPSMLAIFRLYMRNLSISYTNMCGEFTVCGVGWVRDLVLCWIKGVWTGAVLGSVLKYHSCLLTAMSVSGLHFWYVQCILEKLYYLWTKCKVLLFYIRSLCIWGLLFIISILCAECYVHYPLSAIAC